MKLFILIAIQLFFVSACFSQVVPGPPQGSSRVLIDSTNPAWIDTAGNSLLVDVNNAYNEMEKSIEQAYAKLIRENRQERSALEEKIKALDQQIQRLKDEAAKIQKVMEKLDQIMQQLMNDKEKSKASVKKQKDQTLLSLRKSLIEQNPKARSENQEIKLRIKKATEDSLRRIPVRYKEK